MYLWNTDGSSTSDKCTRTIAISACYFLLILIVILKTNAWPSHLLLMSDKDTDKWPISMISIAIAIHSSLLSTSDKGTDKLPHLCYVSLLPLIKLQIPHYVLPHVEWWTELQIKRSLFISCRPTPFSLIHSMKRTQKGEFPWLYHNYSCNMNG